MHSNLLQYITLCIPRINNKRHRHIPHNHQATITNWARDRKVRRRCSRANIKLVSMPKRRRVQEDKGPQPWINNRGVFLPQSKGLLAISTQTLRSDCNLVQRTTHLHLMGMWTIRRAVLGGGEAELAAIQETETLSETSRMGPWRMAS